MREDSKARNEREFAGDIISVRAVEDCIRATKKYTEGVRTIRTKHPVQGEEFSSKVFCKYYEVYPEVDTSHMSLGTIIEWLSGYSTHLDVIFKYDYRTDEASVTVKDGRKAVGQLARAIPNFSRTLREVRRNGNRAVQV